jgi:methionyl-tRNA formyltransferase
MSHSKTIEAAAFDAAVKRATCVLFAYSDAGYAFMQTLLELGAPIAALFTHQDDPHEEIWWRSCAELATRNSIPVFAPDRVDAEMIARVIALRPAIVYSAYYRFLLPDAVLNAATIGAFNLHGSLLPKYRGRAPVNWMLVNGEREAGLTLHHMVSRADAGDIVAQRAYPIEESDTAQTVYRKLVPLAAEIIREYHPLIVEGRAPRIKQDLSRGTYFGRRRPADGQIDWRWPARRIFNLVRAVAHPYPGAFCFATGKKLFVWESRIASESGMKGAPGQIIEELEGGLEIAAGQGSLIVARVQFEGEIEGTAREVLGSATARPRALL